MIPPFQGLVSSGSFYNFIWMLHHSTKVLAWVLVLLSETISHAQGQNFPVDEWEKKLSVKKDDCAVLRREVFNAIDYLDSINKFPALFALEETPGNNRFQMRVNLIKGLLALEGVNCPENSTGFPSLEQSLQKAYEIEDNLLASELNMLLGQFHMNRAEYSMGAMYLLMGWDLARKEGLVHFTGMPLILYVLADGLYKSRDYRSAVKFNQLAIQYRIVCKSGETDTLTKYWAMNTWNNLGLCYERLQLYDSAFIAFNHAYDLLDDSEENVFWRGLIKGNRGDVFFLQGQYDSAAPLLQFDYERSMATLNAENASMSLQRLARIRNSKGDHDGALSMLREAHKLIQNSSIIDYHKSILEAMAIVFRDLGQADSAFVYLEESKKYEIMTENHAAQNRMDIVQLRMNNEQNIHRILQLSREKKQIKLIRNFIIALTLLGAAFGFLYFNRQRLKMRLRQQEALEAKNKAEAEARNAEEQLTVFTQRVLEKTNLVEKLQDELKQRELSEEQLHHINELSQHSILTDSDWEQFKNLFEKVYPGFFIRLKTEVPDITIAEQRMAALSKLQVSAKEAATLLGISHNSVNKTRSRLRQRLGLHPEMDLETYFAAEGK